jgi:hypothetical protein
VMADDGRIGVWVVDSVVDRSRDRRLVEFDIEEVARQVRSFGEQLVTVLADLPFPETGFAIDEVTVSAEIGAKGKLSLLGSGAEASAGAGLTFVLKRRPAAGSA